MFVFHSCCYLGWIQMMELFGKNIEEIVEKYNSQCGFTELTLKTLVYFSLP